MWSDLNLVKEITDARQIQIASQAGVSFRQRIQRALMAGTLQLRRLTLVKLVPLEMAQVNNDIFMKYLISKIRLSLSLPIT